MQSRVQDGYSDAVTQGRTSPPSSHGSCKPIDEYPNALRGPCRCGDKAGVPKVSVSQLVQKLSEWARRVTGLQPTGLAFGRVKITALLGKSITVISISGDSIQAE